MATAFTRTLRLLEGESRLGTAWAGVVLAGLWLVWCVEFPVSLYATTGAARLEMDQSATGIQTTVGGRVVAARLTIGREVAAGEVLVELDASAKATQLAERRAAIGALELEIASLRRQMAAETASRREDGEAAAAAAAEARAGEREAAAPAAFAAGEMARLRKLAAGGLISERELEKGQAAAEQARAAAQRQQLTVSRTEREYRVRDAERETRLRKLESEIAHLEGEIQANEAAAEVIRKEMEPYTIRAPIGGRIGDSMALRPGMVTGAGERLGTIVPEGRVQIVASFAPETIGRVVPGQAATMRLEGFAWNEFGPLRAVVSRVGREVRDGAVRVELTLTGPAPARIPIGHGLPGAVEVETERVTPAALLLRYAGRL